MPDTSSPAAASRRVAYLVNLYPAISHTFIRREIEALEAMGWTIERFAIRQGADLVDEQDKAEAMKTSTILPLKPLELLVSLGAVVLHPRRAFVAAWITAQMAIRSDRGFLIPMFYLLEAAVLLRRMRLADITHAHAHFGTNPTSLLRIVKALGGPTYSFTNHGPLELDNPYFSSLRSKLIDARFVVAISNFARAQLIQHLPVDAWDKVHVVRCGLRFCDAPTPPAEVPASVQLVSIGRLSPEKGQLVLLRAIARVVRQRIPVSLVIAGDGPLRSTLQAEIDRLELRGKVHIAGWVAGERVGEMLRTSRALVLPSLAEGLPVVLMEAFRAGRPVIASNVGAIGELVHPGVSGWLVPPSDEEGLAEAICEAVTLPPERLTEMGRAGYQTARRLHDICLEAQKLSTLFNMAIGGTE